VGGSSLYIQSLPSWPDPVHFDLGSAAFSCSPHFDLGSEEPVLERALGSSPSPRWGKLSRRK
jgi:hypothetical protein